MSNQTIDSAKSAGGANAQNSSKVKSGAANAAITK